MKFSNMNYFIKTAMPQLGGLLSYSTIISECAIEVNVVLFYAPCIFGYKILSCSDIQIVVDEGSKKVTTGVHDPAMRKAKLIINPTQV